MTSLEHACTLEESPSESPSFESDYLIKAAKSGIYQGFDKKVLMRICIENDCVLQLMQSPGSYVLIGGAVMKVNKKLDSDILKSIRNGVYLQASESIKENFFFGFRQLTEIALKALSPGINDPGTAIQSMRALFQLYTYRLHFFPENTIKDKESKVLIIVKELTFDQIFKDTIYPIWDYGKEDRLMQNELHHLLENFLTTTPEVKIAWPLLKKVKLKLNDSAH